MDTPISFFSELRDLRVERTKAYSLEDILFIAIASVICGAETREGEILNNRQNLLKNGTSWYF
jgi:hypothetical protein